MTPEVERTAAQLRLVTGQLVRQIRSRTAAVGGLPVPQAAVLGLINRDGPMTTSQLAAAQSVRHQSAARVVSQLAAQGMVRLMPHATDGRKLLVTPTAAGTRALETQRTQRVEWLAQAIESRLSPAEQRTLAKGVDLLSRLLDG
jgi:DNA-binding MarR family transcriptional regulator